MGRNKIHWSCASLTICYYLFNVTSVSQGLTYCVYDCFTGGMIEIIITCRYKFIIQGTPAMVFHGKRKVANDRDHFSDRKRLGFKLYQSVQHWFELM